MGEGHPEQPDRLRAIERALESEVFQMLARDVAPRAEISAIERVHPLDYIETIRAGTPTQGRTAIDDDTSMSPGSFEAALRSAGGAIFAVDEVMTQKVRNAFVATRPPGHHAEVATPMGFCFFNNAAIAAQHAQAAHGAERVAIVEFGVHHGNGTQHIFWADKTVMYASTHEMPQYPGTGSIGERGEHDQIVNAPLRAGDGGEAFREAMEIAILPRVEAFSPDVIVVSAGFDAHHRDLLGNLNLIEADYAWVTRRLMEIAANHDPDGCVDEIGEVGSRNVTVKPADRV
jgi:acetoin utilization deacetylase AcuC-like enzyme